jgi:hypothetical protein
MRFAYCALGACLTVMLPSAEARSAAPSSYGFGAELSVVGLDVSPLGGASASADAAADTVKVPAKQSAKVEVLVLHATSGGTGIDPKLGDMPELKKPPFSSYDSYRLLDQSELVLEQGTASAKPLPDKGKLTLTLKEIVLAKKKDELDKFVLNASIVKPDDKPFLPSLDVNAHAKERLFIAGQKYDKGILVIVLRVL